MKSIHNILMKVLLPTDRPTVWQVKVKMAWTEKLTHTKEMDFWHTTAGKSSSGKISNTRLPEIMNAPFTIASKM